ncbi:conserved hypothetical protein [Talaromyces stipitatus ATCC 10500]|uniref:Amidohydrolase-related domain-containing protein n=1 Tax=Talaromyces stipitatus (strain ATCC 10500 / CBS 375.48 / QM 6759 / NRRL 1006) TaxID=441959 RepID=B8MSD6_TALSN|nr:uncharacterized protein TSTA_003800 [Talaromyces stipitatus ATCC 10500]EED12323.1 conserved hypothetical protein [Talaromyces stipitatus ATCC 10500]
MPPKTPSPAYIHIKNASLITVNSTAETLNNYDILIKGDTIISIGPDLDVPLDADLTVIDAENCIVVPGFVDGHHHMWQQIIRGVTTDWTLFDYLVNIRSLYGSVYTAEDVELAYYAAALDLLNNGVTCVLEHSHIINSPKHADAAIRGLKKAGIRGCFCYGFYENPPIDGCDVPGVNLDKFKQEQRVCDVRRVREVHFTSNDPAEDLLTFGIAPTEPESQPLDETVPQVQLSRELGARITTMHVAMGSYDKAHQEVVQHLANGGHLGPDLVFSHGASLTDRELDSIRSAGAGLVGTPDTELQMGMGFLVVFRAADKGCKACGAEVLRLDHLVGSIIVGKKADLVIFRFDDVSTVPVHDPTATVVFHASSANIDTVIVNGRIVKNGSLVGVDWPLVRTALRTQSERIKFQAAKVDLATARAKWLEIISRSS